MYPMPANLFDVSDEDCKATLAAFEDAAERKAKAKKPDEVVQGPQDWVASAG